MLKLAGLRYKVAGWYDLVSMVANVFFGIIYRLGLTKEQVVGWLESLLEGEETTTAAVPTQLVPDDLVDQLAAAMSQVDVPSGKFLQALIKKISTDPPAGYRWRKTDQGTYLVKQKGPRSTERPVTRGKKFDGKAWVGVWWHTDVSKGAHARLRSTIKRLGGTIFHRKRMGAGFTEYFAGFIVPVDHVRDLGSELEHFEGALQQDSPDAQLRLSAIDLSKLSENQPVRGHDAITIPHLFKSQKFNWEFNVQDLINGRVTDSAIKNAVKAMLKDYQP